MDKEYQYTGFDRNGEMGPFFGAVTGEETAEEYEEEVMPEGGGHRRRNFSC